MHLKTRWLWARGRQQYLSWDSLPSLKLIESGFDWSLFKERHPDTEDFGLFSDLWKSIENCDLAFNVTIILQDIFWILHAHWNSPYQHKVLVKFYVSMIINLNVIMLFVYIASFCEGALFLFTLYIFYIYYLSISDHLWPLLWIVRCLSFWTALQFFFNVFWGYFKINTALCLSCRLGQCIEQILILLTDQTNNN